MVWMDPSFGLITLPVWVDEIDETRSGFEVNQWFEWILLFDWSLSLCQSTRLARPDLASNWINGLNGSFLWTNHSPCVSRRDWRDPIWLRSDQTIRMNPCLGLITPGVWIDEIGETRSGFEVNQWFESILSSDWSLSLRRSTRLARFDHASNWTSNWKEVLLESINYSVALPIWLTHSRSFQVDRPFECILLCDWSLSLCQSTRLATHGLASKWTVDSNWSFFLTDHSPYVNQRDWWDPSWLPSEQMIRMDPWFGLITPRVWIDEIGDTRSCFQVNQWFEPFLSVDWSLSVCQSTRLARLDLVSSYTDVANQSFVEILHISSELHRWKTPASVVHVGCPLCEGSTAQNRSLEVPV